MVTFKIAQKTRHFVTEGYKNNKAQSLMLRVMIESKKCNRPREETFENPQQILCTKTLKPRRWLFQVFFKLLQCCFKILQVLFCLPPDRVKQSGFLYYSNNITTNWLPLFTFHQHLQINSGYQSLDRTIMCIFRNHFLPRSPKPADMENKLSKYFCVEC